MTITMNGTQLADSFELFDLNCHQIQLKSKISKKNPKFWDSAGVNSFDRE